MNRRDRWIVGLAAAAFLVLVVSQCVFQCLAQATGNLILAFTGMIVLWYTLETARLRRDAELKTSRESEPLVWFEVLEKDADLPALPRNAGPAAARKAGCQHRLRFQLVNYSRNQCHARVRVRLRAGSEVGSLPESSPYGGAEVWKVTPFFNITGWFDLFELAEGVRSSEEDDRWPTGAMTLNAQVDLYRLDGTLLETVPKEYTVRIDLEARRVTFYPEIRAHALPPVPAPSQLPSGERVEKQDAL